MGRVAFNSLVVGALNRSAHEELASQSAASYSSKAGTGPGPGLQGVGGVGPKPSRDMGTGPRSVCGLKTQIPPLTKAWASVLDLETVDLCAPSGCYTLLAALTEQGRILGSLALVPRLPASRNMAPRIQST